MARKSRKTEAAHAVPAVCEVTYNTALYVRLSIEDSGKEDGDSLRNQQLLLEQYIAVRPEFVLKKVFVDNGETGTNFFRPAWNDLITDCKSGKINCLIVKDLSRIGRNYIETGEYLDKIFPLLGVRVIAINDKYDNLGITCNEQFIANIKNLVNDIYAKDLSRKVKTVKQAHKESGDFIGSYAPYGYIKLLDKQKKIVVDPETAPIVRQIFKWKAEGFGQVKILQLLNDAGIPSPHRYRYMKGIIKSDRYKDGVWTVKAVKDILSNHAYLGHTVQNKYNRLINSDTLDSTPKADAPFIVENTHEPIVTQELFDAAHVVIDSRTARFHELKGKYAAYEKPEKPLAGLVFCSDCGKLLLRKKFVSKSHNSCYWIYYCPTADVLNGCSKKYIYNSDLNDAVFDAIRVELQKCADIKGIIEKLNRTDIHKMRLKAFDMEVEEAERELKRIASLRQSVFENYATKLLSVSEYQYAIKKYDTDADKLKVRIDAAKRDKVDYEQQSTPVNKWLSSFSKFAEAKELTAGIAQALIERIEVSNRNCVAVIFKFRDEYKALSENNELTAA